VITAPFDGYARTHDDARDLIRGAVPGARVVFFPKTPRSTGYEITVRVHGAPDVCVAGAYSLPAPAAQIANHARTQVERAMPTKG
jgi:hypothetical protein